jgi:hypothetical protein
MFSYITIVQKNADRYNVGTIYPSTRNNKKYMIISNGKRIHFGDPNYADYTGHKDETRRNNFLIRNRSWKTAPKFSSSWLSYFLLWN